MACPRVVLWFPGRLTFFWGLCLGLLGLGSTSEAQTTFSCDSTFYQIRTSGSSSLLYRLNRDATPYAAVQLGGTLPRMNALGYDPADNYLYALGASTNILYQIDATGAATSLGAVSGLTARDYNNATFDGQGNFYVTYANTNTVYSISKSGSSWSAVALTFTNATTPGATVNSGDIAFDPVSGLLYGFRDTQLISYNLTTLTVTTRAVTGYATPVGSAGSVFFDASGTFYAYRNEGGFYTINTSTGAASLVSSSGTSPASDGASCVYPDYKIDVVKGLVSVTRVDLKTYDATFQVSVGNRYTTTLPNVQVNDFLGPGTGTTFATSSTVVVTSTPVSSSGPCLANSGFGSSDSRLLSGTVALAAGASCTLSWRVRVTYASPPSVPAADPTNTAYASSRSVTNSGYTLINGSAVPPTQFLAAERSTNAATLPATANGDTPSVTPVPLQRTPQIELLKQVRNQTLGGAFGTTATAKPGEVLEYCIRMENTGSDAARALTVTDALELTQTFVSGAYGSGYGFRLLAVDGSQINLYTTVAGDDAADWNDPASLVTFRRGDFAAGLVNTFCFQSRVR